MKVIFLDIDGVLNTSETFKKRHKEYLKTGIWNIEIDDHRVEKLERIVEKTDAKIVLSSSWRYFGEMKDGKFVPKNEKAEKLIKKLEQYGLHIYDITPVDQYGYRANEINEWLKDKDVESFVILDDESSFLIEFIGKELIKTSLIEDGEILKNMDDCTGLCEEHVDLAISKLNKEKKKVKRKI